MTTPPQYRLVATVGGEGTKAAAAADGGGAGNGADNGGGATLDGGGGSDGENQILTVLGGKASCRRKFVIHVHLVDAQGNAVVKDEYEQLSIVATVAYAHDKSSIAPPAPPPASTVTEQDPYGGGGSGGASNGSGNQQQILAEPPLLTTFNGVEYPSHHRPSRLVSGKASFKLAISLLSSKYDNRLFCICFSPLYPKPNNRDPNSSAPPLFPCYSKPIRSISRKRSSSTNAAAATSILHLSHPSGSAVAASNFLPNNLTAILNPNPARKPHHRRPSRSSTAAAADIHLRQYHEFCTTVADCFLQNSTVASNSGSTSASTTSTDDLQYQHGCDKNANCAASTIGGGDAESGSGSLCYISGNSFKQETHFLQINQGHTSTDMDIAHDYIIDEDQRDVSPNLIFPANLLDMNLEQHRYEEEAMAEQGDRRQRCRSIATIEDPFMSPGALTHSVQDPCKLYEFTGGSVHLDDPLLIFQDADCVTEPLDMGAGGGGMGYIAGADDSPVYMEHNGNAAISPDGSASSGSREHPDFWRYSSRVLSGGRDWLAGLQQTPPPPALPPRSENYQLSGSPFRPYAAAKSCGVAFWQQAREDQVESPESLFLLDMAEEEEEEEQRRRCISSTGGGVEGQVMVQELLMEAIRNMGEEEDGEEVLMKMEATLKRAMAEVGRKKAEMIKCKKKRGRKAAEVEGGMAAAPPAENGDFLSPSPPWLPPEGKFCCF